MKNNMVNLLTASFLIITTLLSCSGDKNQIKESKSDSTEDGIFPKGQLGPATNFTGHAYNFGLVANDSTYNTLVGNVYFKHAPRVCWNYPKGTIDPGG